MNHDKVTWFLLSIVIALGGSAWIDMKMAVGRGNEKLDNLTSSIAEIQTNIGVQANEIENQGDRIGGLESRVFRLESSPKPSPMMDVRRGFLGADL